MTQAEYIEALRAKLLEIAERAEDGWRICDATGIKALVAMEPDPEPRQFTVTTEGPIVRVYPLNQKPERSYVQVSGRGKRSRSRETSNVSEATHRFRDSFLFDEPNYIGDGRRYLVAPNDVDAMAYRTIWAVNSGVERMERRDQDGAWELVPLLK